MRVLHVNSGRLHGGVEIVLETLHGIRHFAPEVETEFAVSFDGRPASRLEEAGATVHHLGPARASRPLSVLRARRAFRALLRRRPYDVVVCHLAWSHAIFGPVARAAGVPLASWYHDPVKTRPLHWSDAWALRTLPDVMICNSRYSADLMRRVVPGTRVEVFLYPIVHPEPLPPGDRAAARAELSTPEDATVIIEIARWDPHKGQKFLVEGLGPLADRPGWVCWMIGEPQRPHEILYRDQTLEAADRLDIRDRLRLPGWRADSRRLLAAADVYCQPNAAAEPFGITFVEALYAGVPAISTAQGGPTEIIDASCGLLTPPGDAAALTEALRGLIDDPARRAAMGAAGPGRARLLCDPATQLAALNDILRSVTAREMSLR